MTVPAKSPEDTYGFQIKESAAPRRRQKEARALSFDFEFRDHHGFEKRIPFGADVNADSVVVASITEVGIFGGQIVPFQGAASMEVHNVVPHNNGIVIVRGYIGWDSDINVRLNFLIQ
jgi:hypothetical protein